MNVVLRLCDVEVQFESGTQKSVPEKPCRKRKIGESGPESIPDKLATEIQQSNDHLATIAAAGESIMESQYMSQYMQLKERLERMDAGDPDYAVYVRKAKKLRAIVFEDE